jgi:hypothetical protein
MLEPAFQQLSDSNAPFAIGEGQQLLVVSGGQLPNYFLTGPGSNLILRGGSAGSNFKAMGGQIEVTDGVIGSNFAGLQNLELIVSGGKFESGFSLFAGAHAIISGGSLPTSYRIDAGAIVDIYGSAFWLNDKPISALDQVGEALVLTSRDGQVLKVVLKDGSILEWQLNSAISPLSPFGFSSQATLTLHLVPEPAALVLAAHLTTIVLITCRRRGTL